MRNKNVEISDFKTKQPKKRGSFSAKIQTLGRTFILPIAMLSFSGILLGIGASLTSDAIMKQQPWLKTDGLYQIMLFIKAIGNVGFTILPFMFVMAIPIGLASDNKGVAALSGFVSYITLLFIINFMINVLPEGLTGEGSYMEDAIVDSFGVKTMDVGVLGAILLGLLAWQLHEKTQYIKLPNAISFWGGRRFPPLAALLSSSAIAIPLTFIWPGFNMGISYVGQAVQYVDWFGPFLYGASMAIVRPTGMHHVVSTLIRFTGVGGQFLTPDGQTIEGALNIFYYQLNSDLPISNSVTRFLSGGYMPTVLFTLPSISAAIYFTAPKDQRKAVLAAIIPGNIATVVGGITEPIEFLFIFASPILWLSFAGLSGLGYMVVGLVGIRIGNTDGNIIDLIVFWMAQGLDNRWWLLFIIGPIFGLVSFVLFYYYIKFRNIKTLGRENVGEEFVAKESDIIIFPDEVEAFNKHKKDDFDYQAACYLYLLGGATNIKVLDNCFSRLRITLNTEIDINLSKVKQVGAIGLKIIDATTLQIIVGTQVEHVKNAMKKQMGVTN